MTSLHSFLVALLATIIAMASPSSAGAGSVCVKILATSSGPVMVNACGSCRKVEVERDRKGGSLPVRRTYVAPPSSRIDLKVTAAGRIRILRDLPCDGASAQPDPAAQGDGESCVIITSRPRIGPVLVNGCQSCRAGLLERIYEDGERRSEPFALGPGSAVPLDAMGASGAVVAMEGPCRVPEQH